ncbi:MAG: tetratricopeptide repeat protein [Opitutales bacterium]|nr:tetratricopeptide repeat protein [Opitutales bacterium]
MYRKILKLILSGFASTFLLPSASVGQIYPLSENTWSNPEFVKRFMGSYGVDTERSPGISSQERDIFNEVSEVIGENPQRAAELLAPKITSESSAALDYTLANIHFQIGNTERAAENYKKAIAKFPNFRRAYMNLGILYIQNGEYEEALPHLLKTIELGGGDGNLFGLVAFAHLNLGRSAQALPAYRMARMFAPYNKDWAMGEIQCLMNMSIFDEAIGLLDELITRHPDDSSLLLLQANAFVGKQDLDRAVANLEMVRSMGAETLSSLGLLADIYMNMNQHELALTIYLDTLEYQELDRNRAFRIAEVLAQVGAWNEVTTYIDSFEERFSDSLTDSEELKLLNLKAEVALAEDRETEAIEMLQQVVRRDPLNGSALLLIASYHWRQDDHEEAIIYFERAERVDDTEVEALIQHARMRVSLREFDRAVELLQRAQMLEPRGYVADYLEMVQQAARSARN